MRLVKVETVCHFRSIRPPPPSRTNTKCSTGKHPRRLPLLLVPGAKPKELANSDTNALGVVAEREACRWAAFSNYCWVYPE
jgi:hypothetical protein